MHHNAKVMHHNAKVMQHNAKIMYHNAEVMHNNASNELIPKPLHHNYKANIMHHNQGHAW